MLFFLLVWLGLILLIDCFLFLFYSPDEDVMRRSDIIINSILKDKKCGDVNHYTLLLLIHYTFNISYPYEGYGEWDVDVEHSKADEYCSRIHPAQLSKIGLYIKELWDVR